MGDGRYYTADQFFHIILFTALIILVVIVFMLNLYKVEKQKGSIRIMGGTLLLSLLCIFTYKVAYRNALIHLSQNLSIITLFLYLLVNAVLIVQNTDDRKYTLGSFLPPLFVPFILQINLQTDISILYVLYSLHFVLISNRFTKYKVSSSVFSDAKKHILDYVFIISISGDLIFENDKVRNSPIFASHKTIDVEHIENVFNYRATIRNAFFKQFIKVESDITSYFQYHKKEIRVKDKVVGYILTFADVTELILMLDKLSANREQTKKTTLELDKYKDIVYDLEKEKEVNLLLHEIANNQQKGMYELKDALENIHIDDDNFLDQLEYLSEKAKSNLKDVREAVTSYIKYYQ